MPYKDTATDREYQRLYKAGVRAAKREERRRSLHRLLGIKTYVHHQAVLFDPLAQGGRGRNWARTDQHWYRYPVTLARVA